MKSSASLAYDSAGKLSAADHPRHLMATCSPKNVKRTARASCKAPILEHFICRRAQEAGGLVGGSNGGGGELAGEVGALSYTRAASSASPNEPKWICLPLSQMCAVVVWCGSIIDQQFPQTPVSPVFHASTRSTHLQICPSVCIPSRL